MNAVQTPIGLRISAGDFTIIFGDRNSSAQAIAEHSPQLSLRRIKQTHGDAVVQASEEIKEADAHFTNVASQGLLISTADCLPVFIADQRSGTIAAIHAGWRGVANRIVPKTITRLLQDGLEARHLLCWIGPHIRQPSFEIQAETISLLQASVSRPPTGWLNPSKNEGRSLADLTALMREQLRESGLVTGNIFDIEIDTFTDRRFHSHRRDAAQAGRNISFIFR